MRSIITNPIRKVEYDRNHKVTLIYVNSKKYFYFDRYDNDIAVEEIMPDGSINKEFISLRRWNMLQIYKDCFLLLNNRGGLIYA